MKNTTELLNSWADLTTLTQEKEFVVEKVRLKQSAIAIEGQFELPPLMKLSEDEQIFIAAFVKAEGSIKEMEKFFGVSYPTIKNRLTQIKAKLDFINIEVVQNPKLTKTEILEKLDKGEINIDEATELLRK